MNSLIVVIILFGHYYSSESTPRVSEVQTLKYSQFKYISNNEADECKTIMANVGTIITDKNEFIKLFNSHSSVNNNAKPKVLDKIRNYPNGMEFYPTQMFECLNLQKEPSCLEKCFPCLISKQNIN
ncbi:uncharacterized protein LOC126907409 isoform X1 [Daktulosphaira vitifoliae]|uniref:uncharacterized protein LOC126907409 isoform X1 n=1 Tax=Daktulosphaira vitifoliae TaxID=58002 RepID=UPI0021AAF88F|nr:uncharacterized protein LOC126907409 isoform X1 [Daktulosphaira vitifoliae]